MKDFIISIDWYGPFTRHTLHKAALRGGYYAGMYMALDPIEGPEQKIRYIGISTKDFPWRVRWDREPPDPLENATMWGGLVFYYNAPDKSYDGESFNYSATINDAETILVYMLQPQRNKAKVKHLPKDRATIVNRWFDGEQTEHRRNRPFHSIPDFIEYQPALGATLAWHDEPPLVRRMSASEVRSLGIARTST